MSSQIQDLLDRIEEAYPPERLQASRHRLSAVWDGRTPDDCIPFVFRSMPPPVDPDLAQYSRQSTNEESLLYQLGRILDRSVLCDDYVPGLFPGLRQLTVPSIFGATEVSSGVHAWVDPIIKRPEDVYSLPEPDFGPGTMAYFMLERARYFLGMTEGRIGVNIPDLQGAFSVASQLWGVQGFLLAIYEHPDAVKEFVRRTSSALVQYIRMLRDAIGEHLVPIHCMPEAWMPSSAGICMSEDLIAVVSPGVFTEFIAPSLEELARESGACYAHSCGSIEHNLDALMAVPGLRGLNFSTSETDVRVAAEMVGSKLMLMPHTAPVASQHLRLLNQEEHAQMCFEAFREHHTPGFVYVNCLPGHYPHDPEMMELASRIREWGHL